MNRRADAHAPAHGTWVRRMLWLLALWLGGVAAIAVITAVLKLLMRAAGLAA